MLAYRIFVFPQVKVAKKIAKDMERWAKAQNKKNETGKVRNVI